MANSLEVRLPFLDHHLVEHVLNYPTDVKIRKGEQKYLLKKYLEKSLSKELIYRKKWGFGAPVDEWMQNGLKNTLETYLSRERVLKCGLVEPALVQSMLKDFFKGKHFLYKRLWALMVLHIWFEKHR
jgi:asparagine synthase (glutamine-hydrolysing)